MAMVWRNWRGLALTLAGLLLPGCGAQVVEPLPGANERLHEVRIGHRWGYIDERGGLVVSPRFDEAYPFREGYALARPFFGRWVVVDTCGNQATVRDAVPVAGRVGPHDPRILGAFGDGLCPARERGWWGERRYGYIGPDGNWAIAPRFAYACPFSEGLAGAEPERGGLVGYIDTTGAWAIAPRFETAQPFSEGLALVRYRDQWAICDRARTVRSVNPRVGSVWCFSEGLCSAVADGANGQLGFLGPDGEWAIEPCFARAWYPGHGFSEGLAPVAEPGSRRFGYIDTTGAWQIPPRFERVGSFEGGVAPACEPGGAWGYIDTEGNWAIPPRYHAALPFQGGLAKVDYETDVLGIRDAPGAYVGRDGRAVWRRDASKTDRGSGT